MDQQEAERDNQQVVNRPSVLMGPSATQLAELASQVDERDRQGFDWRAESFGWTSEQIDEVWSWFEQGHHDFSS